MYKRLILVLLFLMNSIAMMGFPYSYTYAKVKTVDEWLEKDHSPEEESITPPLSDFDDMDERGLSFPFFKMLIALAFIIVIIYALAKFINKRTRTYSGNRLLETLGGIPVGQNRSIQIVKVGNRLFVVGVADDIHLLKEIDDEDEIQQIIQEHEARFEEDDFLTKSKDWLLNRQRKQHSFSSILEKQFKHMKQEREQTYDEVKNQKESRNE